jgi:maltose alpha-D-glucosyltransferase/alpha-amylase
MSTSASEVLAIRYDWRGTSLLTLHNFADRQVKSAFDLNLRGADLLVDVFNANGDNHGRNGRHEMTLEPYAWRWFRVGTPDNAVHRASR